MKVGQSKQKIPGYIMVYVSLLNSELNLERISNVTLGQGLNIFLVELIIYLIINH
jgi:hypothetical protein